jgi:hypothetical protein
MAIRLHLLRRRCGGHRVGQTAAPVRTHRHLPTRPHQTLTGYDPGDPQHRFILQAAVLGARVLNWPSEQLPTAG